MTDIRKQVSRKCVHYNGLLKNKTCAIGVAYADVRDKEARPYRFPCLQQGGHCDKFQAPTEQQVQEEVAALASASARALVAYAAVKEAAQANKGYAGMVPCECGGTLHYSVARENGHLRVKCDKCSIGFME